MTSPISDPGPQTGILDAAEAAIIAQGVSNEIGDTTLIAIPEDLLTAAVELGRNLPPLAQ